MLPEASGARANISYYGLRDYAGALAELEIARRDLPNDPRLFELTGYILRRRGQQEEGLRTWSARWSWIRATFLLCNRSRSVINAWGAMPRQSALDRALAIVPDNVETQGQVVRCGTLLESGHAAAAPDD